MEKFIRQSAWNNGGTFNNPDLYWYAKGVAELMSRPLNDQTSWWFFAAIHGENIEGRSDAIPWKTITHSPAVPTSPTPDADVRKFFWNQCQHGGWYFAPWHRGYLIALENQIRKAIINLGGPANWALPYWNYFGENNENKIPPAFTITNLPDGSTNPLYVDKRFGPDNDRNIYIKLYDRGESRVNQKCQQVTNFTGYQPPYYGGVITGFKHYNSGFGALEANPHNIVHVDIGGVVSGNEGLMSDADCAALDPIFYLHHCNIDRLWASWNNAGNLDPVDQNWLKGPQIIGERGFAMPLSNTDTWHYTPEDVSNPNRLDYTYDNLNLSISPLLNQDNLRLSKLLKDDIIIEQFNEITMSNNRESEMLGANPTDLEITNSGVKTIVKLHTPTWTQVSKSLKNASPSQLPDRVFLNLENVKGNVNANTLSVSINGIHAGFVSLFGVRKATSIDGHHAGNGLTFSLDISEIIDELYLKEDITQINNLHVDIIPDNEIEKHNKITVGRVSVYRVQQT